MPELNAMRHQVAAALRSSSELRLAHWHDCSPARDCAVAVIRYVALALYVAIFMLAVPTAEARQHRQEATAADNCGADLCVGPGYNYATPSQAARRAQDGQSIGIAAGDYEDCTQWRASVTIRGINGRPRIHGKACNGKALWITRAGRIEIENIEFSGAWVKAENGAAIRHERGSLVLRNVVIRDNQMGILTGHGEELSVEVYDSRFHGQRSDGALAHSIYAGRIGRLVVVGSDFSDGHTGHFIKSVAATNLIHYNRIVDARGTDTSLIDIWGCSDTTLLGNVLVKAGTGGNLSFIGLRPRGRAGSEFPCPEGGRVHATVAYNTAVFTGPKPMWSALVQNNKRSRMPWEVVNNLVVNTGKLTNPENGEEFGRVAGNIYFTHPAPDLFWDLESGDLRPTRPVPGVVDSGVTPDREHSAPAGTRVRADMSDAGALSSVR